MICSKVPNKAPTLRCSKVYISVSSIVLIAIDKFMRICNLNKIVHILYYTFLQMEIFFKKLLLWLS